MCVWSGFCVFSLCIYTWVHVCAEPTDRSNVVSSRESQWTNGALRPGRVRERGVSVCGSREKSVDEERWGAASGGKQVWQRKRANARETFRFHVSVLLFNWNYLAASDERERERDSGGGVNRSLQMPILIYFYLMAEAFVEWTISKCGNLKWNKWAECLYLSFERKITVVNEQIKCIINMLSVTSDLWRAHTCSARIPSRPTTRPFPQFTQPPCPMWHRAFISSHDSRKNLLILTNTYSIVRV